MKLAPKCVTRLIRTANSGTLWMLITIMLVAWAWSLS